MTRQVFSSLEQKVRGRLLFLAHLKSELKGTSHLAPKQFKTVRNDEVFRRNDFHPQEKGLNVNYDYCINPFLKRVVKQF